MNRYMSRTLGPIALAVLAAAPIAANAESSYQTGAGALTANANVDFQITIPKVLFLQVGTGTLLANNGAIDLIQFAPAAASVGNGTPVAGTGGDLTAGAVTAKVITNGGNVSLVANSTGALSNGSGDSINWTQVSTTASTLTTGTTLAAPVLSNTTSNVALTAVNKVVNQDAKWTYQYLNSAVVAPGTYGGTVAKNGRITYTISIP